MASKQDNTRQELENEILDFMVTAKDTEVQPFINGSDPEFMQIMLQFWTRVWEQGATMPDMIQTILSKGQENPESVVPALRSIFMAGATASYMLDYLRVNKQFAKDPETEKRIKGMLEDIQKRLRKNETEQTAPTEDPTADQIPEGLAQDKKAAGLLKPKKG